MFLDEFLFNMCSNIMSLTDGNIGIHTDLNINNDITAVCPGIHLINSKKDISDLNGFLKTFNIVATKDFILYNDRSIFSTIVTDFVNKMVTNYVHTIISNYEYVN